MWSKKACSNACSGEAHEDFRLLPQKESGHRQHRQGATADHCRHERNQRSQPDYLPKLQQELLEVIRKYVDVAQDQVEVQLENTGSCSVLELNITLPGR